MFKRLVFVSAIAFALVSCTSTPIQLSENEIAQYRAPASTLDVMEQKFQNVMQDVSSSAKTKTNYISRLLNINYRIEGEVLSYEKELDQAIQRRRGDPNYSFTPHASETYYRMMQLRFLADEQIATLVHIYSRLYETATDVQLPEALRSRAQRILGGLNLSLRQLSGADRLQALELFESLQEVARRYQGSALPIPKDRLPASARTEWREVESAFAPFEKDDVSHLRRKHSKETMKNAEAASASHEIVLEPLTNIPQADRSPSSEKYSPGTGTYGNIIGRSFPVGLFSFTYDDGPNAGSTVELLELLKSTGTPATMFWLTQNIARFPATVEKAKSLKFPINSHSWSHQNLVKLSSQGLDKEINQAVSVAQDKVGVQPATGKKSFRFFRCPYGACYSPASPAIRSRLANIDLIHAFWTVDSLDWKYSKDPERVYQLTIKGMQASGRGVVLMHDIHASTVVATRKVLTWIKSQKYRLATLENAVDEYNKSVKQ